MKIGQVRVTKCYLIQLLDDDGYEIESRYEFCNSSEAKAIAKEMQTNIDPDKYDLKHCEDGKWRRY